MTSDTDSVNINDNVVIPKDNIGDDDISSVEEEEIRSSAYSVNYNDNLVCGFDASTCSGDNVYDIFRMREKLLLRI